MENPKDLCQTCGHDNLEHSMSKYGKRICFAPWCPCDSFLALTGSAPCPECGAEGFHKMSCDSQPALVHPEGWKSDGLMP